MGGLGCSLSRPLFACLSAPAKHFGTAPPWHSLASVLMRHTASWQSELPQHSRHTTGKHAIVRGWSHEQIPLNLVANFLPRYLLAVSPFIA